MHAQGYWQTAWKRLWADKFARACMAVLALYFAVAIAAAMGWVAADWNREVGVSYANPSWLSDYPNPQGQNSLAIREHVSVEPEARALDPLAPFYDEIEERARQYEESERDLQWTLPLGGDRWGHDILAKTIKAGQVSIAVGLAAALLAVLIGTSLGTLAGFLGRRVDDALEWLYNVFTSVPYILLVLAFAAVLGKGIATVVLVLALTGWTGTYRLIRAEYIKQRSLEYVKAAEAIGASGARRMIVHILPNVSHLMLVQLSQLVVEFIKAEAVLSFLGFGVPLHLVSWGIQINDVITEMVLGKWWQFAATAVTMSVFVIAFGLFTDVLRDALDPKTRRR
ncbi:MAG TPA: ABC transporter permease [Burkholderiales bacterium]|nr:ABC transporter permease [Burkholderiales bacterium]